eukprot:11452567-Alexandrium_andersonii.AAC.1
MIVGCWIASPPIFCRCAHCVFPGGLHPAPELPLRKAPLAPSPACSVVAIVFSARDYAAASDEA